MSQHTVRTIATGEYSCTCGAVWDKDEGEECPAADLSGGLTAVQIGDREIWSAAPVSEAKAQGLVMPDNLLSHRVTWRQALVRLIELEDVADPETGRDDKAYWQHELRAFDDMYADLDRLNAAPVQHVSVPDGKIVVSGEALRTVLNALVNAPHQIRELQFTREPVALFADNPINVLIAEYEAAHAALSAGKEGE